ncbi:MAG: glycosyltransferase [Colwellia sp.]|nr:glycosyltransferase [Colwellia sp.]
MKLAVFVNQFPILSQTFVLNQVEELIAQGVDVTVIALSDPQSSISSAKAVIKSDLQGRIVYLLNEQKRSALHKFLRRSLKLITSLIFSRNKKLILSALNFKYGHHAKSLLLPTIVSNVDKPLTFDFIVCHFGTGGVLINELRDIGIINGKIATIFHGFELSVHKTLLQQKENYLRLFKQTELMLPISDLWKNKLQLLGCPENKISVHRMGVDLSHFIFNSSKGKRENIENVENKSTLAIFTVARFAEKKGLEFAIKALALLTNEVKFHYTIAGFGELLQPLQKLVTELELDDRISFIGPISSVQVKEQMLTHDVFLQPSIVARNGDMEGVPVAIMEAMAMGTVVVSTFHSGIPELITDNEHGLLAKENDAVDLANKIKMLYKNETLQTKLAMQARNRIEEVADIRQLNKQLLSLLAEHL